MGSNYTVDEEKSIVNGAHETNTAQQLIDKFIEKFVLCPNCKLPEIDMQVKKGFLVAGWKACGWSGDLDNNHKLVKFILTNPRVRRPVAARRARRRVTARRSSGRRPRRRRATTAMMTMTAMMTRLRRGRRRRRRKRRRRKRRRRKGRRKRAMTVMTT